ncbi:MAG: DUF3226 domain-containing protein [Chloroflexota bacterium]
MAVEIEQPNVLVVEGREEELFFGAFIQHLRLQNIQTMPISGKEQLRRNLKALVASPGFSEVISLGVVRDANADPGAAFQSVHDALQAVNLPAPELPLVPVGERPRVAVLILPEVGMPGMLEDLCLRAIVQDPAMLCVEQYFECLQQEELPLPDNTSKAKVQVFLASRRKAGLRLGEAAQAGYWPWEAKTFEQVKDFLQRISS